MALVVGSGIAGCLFPGAEEFDRFIRRMERGKAGDLATDLAQATLEVVTIRRVDGQVL